MNVRTLSQMPKDGSNLRVHQCMKKNIYIYTNEYICIFLLYIIYEYRLHNYITNIFVNITYCINI